MLARRRLGVSAAIGLFTIVTASVTACSGDEGEPGTSWGTTLADDAGSEREGGGKKVAAEPGCANDSECETNVCFKGNDQSFCTIECTTDTAATLCVAPYTGSCNRQGYCKRD